MEHQQVYALAAYLARQTQGNWTADQHARHEYDILLEQRRTHAGQPARPSLGDRLAASLRAAAIAFREPSCAPRPSGGRHAECA